MLHTCIYIMYTMLSYTVYTSYYCNYLLRILSLELLIVMFMTGLSLAVVL